MASDHSGIVQQIEQIIARVKYWQAKKLAVDAVRPDFTRDQMRELNAAESRLLAIDPAALSAVLVSLQAPGEANSQEGYVRVAGAGPAGTVGMVPAHLAAPASVNATPAESAIRAAVDRSGRYASTSTTVSLCGICASTSRTALQDRRLLRLSARLRREPKGRNREH